MIYNRNIYNISVRNSSFYPTWIKGSGWRNISRYQEYCESRALHVTLVRCFQEYVQRENSVITLPAW